MNDSIITFQIAELANQHGPSVYHTAYRLLGDASLAEDVSQEVFLKLFNQSLQALHKVQHWPAYLKTMATSISFDLLRKKLRLTEHPLEESSLPEDSSLNPLEQVLLDSDIARFRGALSQLGKQEAHVFVLRHVEEFSYQEIAEQLEISLSLVGVTLNRAKQKLSSLLKESQYLGVSYEPTF